MDLGYVPIATCEVSDILLGLDLDDDELPIVLQKEELDPTLGSNVPRLSSRQDCSLDRCHKATNRRYRCLDCLADSSRIEWFTDGDPDGSNRIGNRR